MVLDWKKMDKLWPDGFYVVTRLHDQINSDDVECLFVCAFEYIIQNRTGLDSSFFEIFIAEIFY